MASLNINRNLLNTSITYTNYTNKIPKDVTNFCRADTDLLTPFPLNVVDILTKSYSNTETWSHYENPMGSLELRKMIADKYKSESDINITPENVMITNGGRNAIFYSLLTITNEGDEILVPDPTYIAYDAVANHILTGRKAVRVPLEESNNFLPTIDLFEKHFTKRTKVLVITSPSNPIGTVYTKEILQDIMNWAIRKNIYVVHDEYHEKEVYDGNKHHPIRKFDPTGNNSILLNSFSRLGMSRWKLGWMIASEDIIKAAAFCHLFVNMYSNPFIQEVGVYALEHYNNSALEVLLNSYKKNRDYLVSELNTLFGFKCTIPQGACYAFPNIKGFYDKYGGMIKAKVVEKMKQQLVASNKHEREKLEKELDLINEGSVSFLIYKYFLDFIKIGVIPGIVYGKQADNYLRFSFLIKLETMEEGLVRLRKMVDDLA